MEVDDRAVASPTQGSSFPDGHEAFITNSCFVVGGLQSLLVSSEAHIITFGPGKEGSAKLLIPKGAIPRGQELRVRYAYLLDGPFSIPENYDIVSPVLYIDYNTSHVKKPLELQLDHWYAGKDRQKNMAFLKAPHVAHEGGVFSFTKYSQGSFSDEEQFAALNLEEDLCCVVVAVKNTGNLPHPANCRLHLLKKVQTRDCTSFRLYITYDHSAWTEVVTKCIVECQGWMREGFAPPQLVTFQRPDDGVKATFIPSKGHGWQMSGQGKQSVQLHEVWQPVRKEYRVQMQQQSSVFSRVLSWLPWELQQCHLRVQIDQEVYPPSIHMDLMYHNPSVKPEINTTLNISCLRSDGGMPFTVKIEVSETPSSLSPPTGPGPTSAQPKEEGATSTEWQSAYEDSIRKHGSVSVGVIQSIFVGPSAAGKSTVKHLLVHNEPKEVKTSTAALETPEVVTKQSAMVVRKRSAAEFSSEQYAVQEGTSAWQPVSSDIMKNSLHHCIAGKEYEEKNQYPIEVEAKEAEDVQREALIMKQAQSDPIALLGQYPIEEGQHEAEDRDGCPLPKQAQSDLASLDQGYSQVREEMGGEGMRIKLKNASFIHLLDTGGQPSYQDVLPLLLDVPCTYIQVFDASRSLKERISVTYRPNDHTVVSLGDAECGRDMMLRSFSSMHTMAQKYSKELATFQQKDSPPPQLRIFVVGTHKDELIAQGRLDEATKEIKTFLETLKGKPYYNSIQWDSKGQKFFLINALSVNERAYVNDLRERISSEGFLKLDVPLMWFICQEVTRCTPKKFFRLQDLEAFCRKHHFVDGENAASQFRALLQLLTLLGFYAFFNLEDVPDEANFVCTDRDVFLREVSTLLAVQFSVPKGPEMESFKETGNLVFTQKCFKQLGICQEMDAQWFVKALQHLGIAAQLHSNNEDCNDCQEFFIPAVLPQSLPTQDPVASVSPLCLTYKIKAGTTSSYTFMPQGVFCRLVVELIRQGWKICRKVKSTRTLLAFNCREFTIYLKESSGYISLIPQVVEEISTIPELQTQCVCLLDTVRDGLSLSAKAVLGSNFGSVAKLAVGFKCPCKEVAMDHLAVPSETGKSLECLEKDSKQDFSNEQRIWFSSLAGVHEVELVKDTKLRIWMFGERPPEPQPKPQPPQPSPHTPVPREGDAALCQEVNDYPDHLMLFRTYVSRNVAGKARAVLEGVGLETSTIDACFSAHPLNDEEVVQAGLVKWRDGQGNKQPPTWEVLISAMEYAGVAQQHVKELKGKLALYIREGAKGELASRQRRCTVV